MGVLASFFPNKEICWTLGLLDPVVISVIPDQPNIHFASFRIKEHGEARLQLILSPLLSQLRVQRFDFPLTLIYGNLQTIYECYKYFSNSMEDEQHHPIGVATIAKNNLFSQFHAQYPDHEREHIVKSLVQGVSTIRVLFVTVAFGIGIDINLKI